MATFNIVNSNQYKECPRCGATLFSDMETCYGCMFNFAAADIHTAEGSYVDGSYTYEDSLDEPESYSHDTTYSDMNTPCDKQYYCSLRLGMYAARPIFLSHQALEQIKQSFHEPTVSIDEVSFKMTS